jgi:hypothetical protein
MCDVSIYNAFGGYSHYHGHRIFVFCLQKMLGERQRIALVEFIGLLELRFEIADKVRTHFGYYISLFVECLKIRL